ncbi:hypothetical protein Fmac_025061 [Flemingia macrophylla]|uniref:Uncharacterized protein n=1 Tax=Flemingia macrophylla TaxID=520843 RepID=A0ABD1LR92_9FABA
MKELERIFERKLNQSQYKFQDTKIWVTQGTCRLVLVFNPSPPKSMVKINSNEAGTKSYI